VPDSGNGRLTYSLTEVADILGISRSKAYDMARLGEIETIVLKGRKLVPKVVVDRMVRRVEPPATTRLAPLRALLGSVKHDLRTLSDRVEALEDLLAHEDVPA
jgi:hypothetical protein